MPKCDAEIPDLETLRTWVTEGPVREKLTSELKLMTNLPPNELQLKYKNSRYNENNSRITSWKYTEDVCD